MAAAYAVMELIEPGETQVCFDTLSGRLTVDKTPDGLYAMDFPAYALSPVPVTDAMEQAIGARPVAAYMGRDLLCVMENENLVRAAQPDLAKAALFSVGAIFLPPDAK